MKLLAPRFCGPLTVILCATSLFAAPAQEAGGQREFSFRYQATIRNLPPGQAVEVWLPVASSSTDQQVTLSGQEVPADVQFTADPKFGNRICYFSAHAGADGMIHANLNYRIVRYELRGSNRSAVPDAKTLAMFLKPDRNVPVGGKPLTLIAGRDLPSDPMRLARLLYDTVDDHMEYRKDKPGWGRGDAVWACDSRFGNWTDFHSLFISLARSQYIASKFEMGFSLPEQRGKGEITGYHCWAKFSPAGGAWIPVDISEANKHPQLRDYYFGSLSADRVCFSTGRDIELMPKREGPPLNFFIDPYVEAAGTPLPSDWIECKCVFEDSVGK